MTTIAIKLYELKHLMFAKQEISDGQKSQSTFEDL